MLMFQNGLFATFIPELLMVAGYLFCLFAPGMKAEPTTPELNSNVVSYISTTQHIHQKTYITSSYDFQSEKPIFSEFSKSPLIKQIKNQKEVFQYILKLSDGLTFEQFSRPPPSLFC